MDKLPHPKHTSVLLNICHHHTDSHLFSNVFFKVEFKLKDGTFQIINHLKNSAFPLKIAFIDKKNNYHIQLFIFLFVNFFHFDFKDAIKYTTILSKSLYFL